MKKLFLLFILGISINASSQALQWANNIGATTCTTVANKVMSDASGSVFNVGYFSGTVDFQSGAGVSALTTGSTSINGYIQKLASNGGFAYVKGFLGTGACNIKSIVADASGNLYVTGGFSGTIDFDPGATSYTMTTTASSDVDVFICKLTAQGVFVWAKQIGNVYSDYGISIDLDASNNVFVNGFVNSMNVSPQHMMIDLDPGAGVSNFDVYVQDGFVVKLDNNGNHLASQNYGGAGQDNTYSMKLDASGNVYICGYSWSGVGQLGIGAPNVYDTGFLAKLTNNLVKTWAIPFKGDYCEVRDLEIDASGNIYTVGEFKGTVDFDGSSTSSYTLATAGTTEFDVFVTKVTSAGVFVWAKQEVSGGSGNAYALSAALDASNNLYFTGYFTGAADFNPTATSYVKWSAGSNDFYVCKLDANGNFNNDAQVYGGAASDASYSISSPAAGTYYICGAFNGAVDFNEGTGSTILTPLGTTDAFVAKYSSCTLPVITTASSSTLVSVCQNATTILAATPASGITFNWYNAAGGGTSLGTGNTFTTSPITTTTSIWAEGANTCAASPVVQYSINMIPSPTVSLGASAANICEGTTVTLTGGGAGITSFTWNTGATTQSISVTPSVTTQYTVLGSNGTCVGSRTVSIGVTPMPTPNFTYTPSSICAGQTTTVSTSGYGTYHWNGGGITTNAYFVTTPTVTGTYSVNAEHFGCNKTFTFQIVVAPSPTLAVSNQTTCAGTLVNLSASGATSYSWNTGVTTASISVTPTTTTNYIVIGTGTGGCTNTKTVSVVVNSSPTITANSSTICAGASTNLSASGATSYSWNTGATTSSISVTPTITTNYTVSGVNAGGCSNTKTVSVIVNSLPNVAVSSTTICAGSTGTLAASGASTYSWNTGGTGANLAVSPTINTTYTVTGTSAAGCVKTATALVTVGSAPSIAINNQSICVGATAVLAASGVTTYTWNTGSNTSSIMVSPPVGVYVYTVSGNLAGCTASTTKTVGVTVNALPVVTLANITSPLCVNNSSVALVGTPSGGTYSGTGVNAASFDPAVSGAGTFTVTYNYTDANTCSAADTKTVMVSLCTSLTENMGVNTGINVYPNPNNGEFTILLPTKGIYTIVNAIGQTIEIIDLKEDAQTIQFNGLSQGIYYLVGKNAKAKIVVTK